MAVWDSGDGMLPETKSRLFDSDGIHSHALGLMPRRLQGLYSGAFSLSIDSAKGDGTTVSLSIPLQLSDDSLERLSQRDCELAVSDLRRADPWKMSV